MSVAATQRRRHQPHAVVSAAVCAVFVACCAHVVTGAVRTASSHRLPPRSMDGVVSFVEPAVYGLVRAPPQNPASSMLLSSGGYRADPGVQVPLTIQTQHTLPTARLAREAVPSCCMDGATRRPGVDLTFHFSPDPPAVPIGTVSAPVELSTPIGTHVITGTAFCVDGTACGSDHMVFDSLPFAMETFTPYPLAAVPTPEPPHPSGAPPSLRLCYYGSVNKVDGVKMAWVQQWRYLAPRGVRIKYVAANEGAHPVLVEELSRMTVEVASRFAHLMLNALVEAGFDVARVWAQGTAAGATPRGDALRWMAECWAVMVSRMEGCEVVVHANGDDGDRLIAEAAKLAGVRAVVGELTGLVLRQLNVGAATVYVGPSSYAVDVARRAFAATAPHNGGESHVWSKAVHGVGVDAVETGAQFNARTAVIHLGVNITRYSLPESVVDAVRARRADPATLKTIGFVGRLSSEKSVGMLLRAFAVVLDAHPTARLHIMGTGFLQPYLQDMAAALGVEHAVVFRGFLTQDQLRAALVGLDFMVFPSLRSSAETFALVNVEAMAMELPVVSFGVPGTLDYFRHGHNALVAANVTVDSLAAHMALLLREPQLAVRLGTAARQTVLHAFRDDVSAASYAGLYRCLRQCVSPADLACGGRCAGTHTQCAGGSDA